MQNAASQVTAAGPQPLKHVVHNLHPHVTHAACDMCSAGTHRGLPELHNLGDRSQGAQRRRIHVVADGDDWPAKRLSCFLGFLLDAKHAFAFVCCLLLLVLLTASLACRCAVIIHAALKMLIKPAKVQKCSTSLHTCNTGLADALQLAQQI